MQKDIRVSERNKIKQTHILLSAESKLFCTNIINKYAFETKLSKYVLLEYLLQKKSSSITDNLIKNIFSSVNFHMKLLQKQFRNYPFVQQVLHQKYTNTIDKRERRDNIFHNQKLIQKKITKKESRELLIDKQKTIFPPIQSVIVKNKKVLKSFSVKNMIKKHNLGLLTDKNKNIIINHLTGTAPFQYRKTAQNRSSKETNIIYAADQNKVSPQAVSSHTAEKNAIEIKNSDHSLTVAQTIENINHYEIKQLAKKVYPLVIKQWQKEFERRGVFYG